MEAPRALATSCGSTFGWTFEVSFIMAPSNGGTSGSCTRISALRKPRLPVGRWPLRFLVEMPGLAPGTRECRSRVILLSPHPQIFPQVASLQTGVRRVTALELHGPPFCSHWEQGVKISGGRPRCRTGPSCSSGRRFHWVSLPSVWGNWRSRRLAFRPFIAT